MAQASMLPIGNDMRFRLAGFKSSTDVSTGFIASSTGITVTIYSTLTTSSTSAQVATGNAAYATGPAGGTYDFTLQSTAHTMTTGTVGLAIFAASHSGLDGRWDLNFQVGKRQAT